VILITIMVASGTWKFGGRLTFAEASDGGTTVVVPGVVDIDDGVVVDDAELLIDALVEGNGVEVVPSG
jgi:hypothetical protein